MTRYHLETIIILLQSMALTALLFILLISLRETPSDVLREMKLTHIDINILKDMIENK